MARAKRRIERAAEEDRQKRAVRVRDKPWRFPRCGCGKLRLPLEVSHGRHKGMGGNPEGDRSVSDEMLLLCGARHREHAISIHRGTLRILPLTARQYAGPCAFCVEVSVLNGSGRWVEVARERTPHVLEPLTASQEILLNELATMTR
mgnify:CR=1 FL=1